MIKIEFENYFNLAAQKQYESLRKNDLPNAAAESKIKRILPSHLQSSGLNLLEELR